MWKETLPKLNLQRFVRDPRDYAEINRAYNQPLSLTLFYRSKVSELKENLFYWQINHIFFVFSKVFLVAATIAYATADHIPAFRQKSVEGGFLWLDSRLDKDSKPFNSVTGEFSDVRYKDFV